MCERDMVFKNRVLEVIHDFFLIKTVYRKSVLLILPSVWSLYFVSENFNTKFSKKLDIFEVFEPKFESNLLFYSFEIFLPQCAAGKGACHYSETSIAVSRAVPP